MSGRRPPRTQQKAGKQRAGKPRTLRTRLVVASLVLIAVVCAVIGTVTTLALSSHLYEQLDGQVADAGKRLAGPPANLVDGNPGDPGRGDSSTEDRLLGFVTKGPTQPKTVAAELGTDGTVSRAVVAEESTDNGTFKQMLPTDLTDAQKAAFAKVSRTGTHTVTLPGLGEYRVRYVEGAGGNYYVALPTETVTNTINTLILVEVSVTGAGLVAAGIASSVLVGVATRPLRKVAATATRVSELPLHTGEVNLSERVPESETDPHTEVGQVGAALNRMLDHVHGALHARQQSETRVRQRATPSAHSRRTGP